MIWKEFQCKSCGLMVNIPFDDPFPDDRTCSSCRKGLFELKKKGNYIVKCEKCGNNVHVHNMRQHLEKHEREKNKQ